MDNKSEIVMYSTQWCGDCVRSKKVFDKLNIKFTEIDIDFDKEPVFEDLNNQLLASINEEPDLNIQEQVKVSI